MLNIFESQKKGSWCGWTRVSKRDVSGNEGGEVGTRELGGVCRA